MERYFLSKLRESLLQRIAGYEKSLSGIVINPCGERYIPAGGGERDIARIEGKMAETRETVDEINEMLSDIHSYIERPKNQ